MTGPSATALTPAARDAVAVAVGQLPHDLSADAALRAVPQLAVLATHGGAASAFPTVLSTAERAELDRIQPMTDSAPKKVSAGYMWWSVVAAVIALIASALVMIGRTGNAVLDPVSGALPSGLCMAAALGLFIWLEPRRTSNPLYHGGNFGGKTFIFIAVLWAVAVWMVFGGIDDVLFSPAAMIGLVVQIVSVVGCAVLAVFALRHDRERPRWSGGRRVRSGDSVPVEVAESAEFRDGVQARLEEWRRYIYRTSTGDERAAMRSAELEAVRLLTERGTLSEAQRHDAEQRVHAGADWR
ncbi:hypothetical protein [Agromyces subbeticus]|uniref:hypothetical protein n=1 Tax=Agromyces subbeticus TaxID=293890 RepID=UPI0003B68027|nr:hypothetical protein [Agromyces subbeticus]